MIFIIIFYWVITISRYIRIDGKTNPEQRKILVDKFQNCNNYLTAILSITAANAGITLTAAHLVVFTELFWNPGVRFFISLDIYYNYIITIIYIYIYIYLYI